MNPVPALRYRINGEFIPSLFLCSWFFTAAKISTKEQVNSYCKWIMIIVEPESSYKLLSRVVQRSLRLLH